MKTQTFGSCPSLSMFFVPLRLLWLMFVSRADYKKKRANLESTKSHEPPFDGKYTWIKGQEKDGYVYGEKRADGMYDYEVRYDEGVRDREWMENNDRMYLKELLDANTLRDKEPAVWYLYIIEDKAQDRDIGDWWIEKLRLPNIEDILKRAEQDYIQLTKDFLQAAQSNDVLTIQRLLKDGIDPNIKDDEGNTALHLSAKRGCVDVVYFLLTSHIINLTTENREEKTALDIARDAGMFEVAQRIEFAAEIYLMREANLISNVQLQFNEDRQITVDLSHNQMQIETAVRLVQVLMQGNCIIHLNLSNNGIDDTIAKEFIPLLREHPSIQTIDFSGNKMTYLGAGYLASDVSRNTSLREIDLSNNFLFVGEPMLQELEKAFKKCISLQLLQMSQNFLKENCDALFQRIEGQQPILCQFSFFYTQPRESRSLIEPNRLVTENRWFVLFACKKGTEHAMIFVEGMRSTGQLFIKQVHITAENILSEKAKPKIIQCEPRRLFNDREKYDYQPLEIDSIQGNALFGFVSDDIVSGVEFSITASYGKANCLVYLRRKLDLINVKIDTKLFPSLTAKGSYCVVQ